MAISSINKVYGEREEKEVLALENDEGKVVIKIKESGSVELAGDLDPQSAAVAFWKSVADYLPGNVGDQIKAKTVLIEAFSVLKKAFDDDKYEDTEHDLRRVYEKMEELFYQR